MYMQCRHASGNTNQCGGPGPRGELKCPKGVGSKGHGPGGEPKGPERSEPKGWALESLKVLAQGPHCIERQWA